MLHVHVNRLLCEYDVFIWKPFKNACKNGFDELRCQCRMVQIYIINTYQYSFFYYCSFVFFLSIEQYDKNFSNISYYYWQH